MKKIITILLVCVMVFSLGLSAFADNRESKPFSDYPELPNYDPELYPYVYVASTNDTYRLYLSTARLKVVGGQLLWCKASSYLVYSLVNGSWVQNSSGTGGKNDQFGSASLMVSANVDILQGTYQTAGTELFADPNFHPPKALQEVIVESVGEAQTKVKTEMMIITSVAVGLIAFLIGLILLSKKLRLFLPR